jgi:nicotinamidase-related amidase
MARSALMLIDLQVDYISGGDLIEGQDTTLLDTFPELPINVTKILSLAREQEDVEVIHVREKDQDADSSTWIPWVGFCSHCSHCSTNRFI